MNEEQLAALVGVPAELTIEQRIEMTEAWRAAHKTGRPQDAQKYRAALDEGVYFTMDPDNSEATELVDQPDPPPRSGKGASKNAWLEWALEVSDVDREVLESVKKNDIIKMMEANSLLPKLTTDDDDE